MNPSIQATLRFTTAIIAVVGCLMVSEQAIRFQGSSFATTAEAVRGRPATPMSYAGVARRTTARAVVAAPVVVVPAATCVQAVDAYGRIYTRCY